MERREHDRQAASNAGGNGHEPVLLESRGPFNLFHTLSTGQAFRWRFESGWWYGVVGGSVWKARQAGAGIELDSWPEPPSAIAPLARRYFRLDDDLDAIYGRLRDDARVAGAIREYHGLRLVRQDPWECLVSFIISAFSNVRRIAGHIEQLSRICGEPIGLDGHPRHTFPSPARFARLGEQDFRRLGLGYRSRYLARLAGSIEDRGLDLLALRSWPYREAKAALLSLDGVGDKVADCVLLFSLDKLEACPIDVWVRRAFTEWYFAGEAITNLRLRAWAAAHFGQDAGYAQQYLFHQRRLAGRAARRSA